MIAKGSVKYKLEWIDKYIDNTLDCDNGCLLNKASDKFLSFCIEYKRLYSFLMDENAMEFNTYLPVQLDATCNGFKHMVLLSNEDTLFKELNLVSTNAKKREINDLPPGDFIDFCYIN